jgi:transcriptional regulator with GAF, ATPase, and Fis domain
MLRMHEYDDRDYPQPNSQSNPQPSMPGLPDYSGQPAQPDHDDTVTDKLLADRLMAVLAVLRRHEMSVEAAAKLAGLSRDQMMSLMRKLSIPFEM